MALNGNTWGVNVAAAVKAAAAAVTPGTPISDAQMENIWKAICGENVTEIQSHAVVQVTGVQNGGGTANGTVS